MKTIDAFTLTPKQQRFCDEYLIDMNATRAALRAGYTQATAMNGQLMEMPKIQAYLKKRTAEAAQKLQVSHETLLGELMKVAFANMGDYFGDDGKIKAMNDILDDKKSAIWSLKVSEGKYGTTVQLRLHNKLAALEKIAKHIKFYEVEQKKPVEEAVYVDKEDLNEDDRFEDDSIDALDKDLYEKKVKLETLQRELYLKERDLKQREADLATREEGVRAAIANAAAAETAKPVEAVKSAVAEAPKAAPGPYDKPVAGQNKPVNVNSNKFNEPIGYRLEQQRNLSRAKTEKYYFGWKL
ncbi:terminase small subunit [uncultured Mucilaginibacter sp.]|uniref:terminase small subunit n=2 Tax=uncultured Mucilaginibacter sp. TaxID=797541 RepID=UPI0025D7180C|nr:terminase small subunit [uncultured Mucilaginibacter sp.]